MQAKEPIPFVQDSYLLMQKQSCTPEKQLNELESLEKTIDMLKHIIRAWPRSKRTPFYIEKVGLLMDRWASLKVQLELMEEFNLNRFNNE